MSERGEDETMLHSLLGLAWRDVKRGPREADGFWENVDPHLKAPLQEENTV